MQRDVRNTDFRLGGKRELSWGEVLHSKEQHTVGKTGVSGETG